MNLNECFLSLELVPTETINDVNKAYKRLMLQWHPDKYQSDEKLRLLAEQKTKEINAARDWLVAHFKGLEKGNGQLSATAAPATKWIRSCIFSASY